MKLSKGVRLGLSSGFTYGLYSVLIMAIQSYKFFDNVSSIIYPILVCGFIDIAAVAFMLVHSRGIDNVRLQIKDTSKSSKVKLVIGSILGGPAATLLYILAVIYGGPVAISLSATSNIIGMVLSHIRNRKKFTKHLVIPVILSSIGCIIVNLDNSDSSNILIGSILAITVAFLWGLEGSFSESIGDDIDPGISVTLRSIISSVITLPISLFLLYRLGTTSVLDFNNLTYSIIVIVLVCGLLTASSYTDWYAANNILGAGLGMTLNSSYLLWGLILSSLLGYNITIQAVVGSLFITTSIIIISKFN